MFLISALLSRFFAYSSCVSISCEGLESLNSKKGKLVFTFKKSKHAYLLEMDRLYTDCQKLKKDTGFQCTFYCDPKLRLKSECSCNKSNKCHSAIPKKEVEDLPKLQKFLAASPKNNTMLLKCQEGRLKNETCITCRSLKQYPTEADHECTYCTYDPTTGRFSGQERPFKDNVFGKYISYNETEAEKWLKTREKIKKIRRDQIELKTCKCDDPEALAIVQSDNSGQIGGEAMGPAAIAGISSVVFLVCASIAAFLFYKKSKKNKKYKPNDNGPAI